MTETILSDNCCGFPLGEPGSSQRVAFLTHAMNCGNHPGDTRRRYAQQLGQLIRADIVEEGLPPTFRVAEEGEYAAWVAGQEEAEAK